MRSTDGDHRNEWVRKPYPPSPPCIPRTRQLGVYSVHPMCSRPNEALFIASHQFDLLLGTSLTLPNVILSEAKILPSLNSVILSEVRRQPNAVEGPRACRQHLRPHQGISATNKPAPRRNTQFRRHPAHAHKPSRGLPGPVRTGRLRDPVPRDRLPLHADPRVAWMPSLHRLSFSTSLGTEVTSLGRQVVSAFVQHFA